MNLNQEVDLYISTGAMSWAKFQVADMSLLVVQDDTAIIVPFPSERSKTALFIAPFQTNVCILYKVQSIARLLFKI